jgi:hypothetical protein
VGSNGDFSGWTWGSNADDGGIGWVSFNSTTDGSPFDYKVVYDNPMVEPVITNVKPTPGSTCSSLMIEWDYDNSARVPEYFRLWSNDTAGPIGSVIASPTNTLTSYNWTVTINTTKYYTISAYDSSNPSEEKFSNQMSGTTLSFCEIVGVIGTGKCANPDEINLSWNVEAADYYIVKRCNKSDTGTDCTIDSGFSEFVSGDNCYHPSTNLCVDTFTSDESDGYRYKVAGVDDDPEPDIVGDWSDTSDIIVPCSNLPIWTEVKVE